MVRRLILDTTALIAFERHDLDPSQFVDDDLAMAAVSIAEYRIGIELADTAERAAHRLAALSAITATVDVLSYTPSTAEEHARLLAHGRRIGRPRGAHDLIIAAHAAETGRLLVSTDAAARFGDLPGVTVLQSE